MNKQEMITALQKAIEKSGISVINNQRQLQAILKDSLPGEIFKFERKALLDVLDIPEWYLLTDVHDKENQEHNRAVNVILPQLEDVLGWKEDRCRLVLECYISAMGWSIESMRIPSKNETTTSSQTLHISSLNKATIGNKTWDVVIFGIWEGKPIEWIVLENLMGKKLLLTKDILGNHPYHMTRSLAITWDKCDLRKYLNSDFIQQAFTSIEQSKIRPATIPNPDNQWYGTKGGGNTSDRVFLLSIDECVRYFGDSYDLSMKRRKDYKGEIAEHGYQIHDKFNANRIAIGKLNQGVRSWYWFLRSPGGGDNSATAVSNDGCIGLGGMILIESTIGGVRPALWMSLN